jgi:hypothetical protein
MEKILQFDATFYCKNGIYFFLAPIYILFGTYFLEHFIWHLIAFFLAPILTASLSPHTHHSISQSIA